MVTRDIITVVRDPRFPLGKRFSLDANGKPDKTARVSISVGVAVQHHVPDISALHDILMQVSEDEHAAVINSAFPLVPIGQEFLILSEAEFKKRGVERLGPQVNWPVPIEHRGKTYPALGRFKEHTAPSSWQYLDRDIDKHTPAHYASMTYEEWCVEVDKLLPGILNCMRLRALSSSARVSFDGVPVGGGNGHTWFQLADANDVERLRDVIKARAIAMGMAWKKAKISLATGEIVGYGIASIIDWSVFTPGRLVFCGKPGIDHV